MKNTSLAERSALTVSLTFTLAGLASVPTIRLLLRLSGEAPAPLVATEALAAALFFCVLGGGLFFFTRRLFERASESVPALGLTPQPPLAAAEPTTTRPFDSQLLHDCNNILAIITLRIEQLTMICPEPEAQVALGKVKEAIARLILQMSKLKPASGKSAEHPPVTIS